MSSVLTNASTLIGCLLYTSLVFDGVCNVVFRLVFDDVCNIVFRLVFYEICNVVFGFILRLVQTGTIVQTFRRLVFNVV